MGWWIYILVIGFLVLVWLYLDVDDESDGKDVHMTATITFVALSIEDARTEADRYFREFFNGLPYVRDSEDAVFSSAVNGWKVTITARELQTSSGTW